MKDKSGEVTRLLHELRRGNRLAAEQLIPIVYNQLNRIVANPVRREKSAHSLQSTALVQERYPWLTKLQEIVWQCRSHFFRVLAAIMRRILVDHARAQQAIKRGEGSVQVTLDSGLIGEVGSPINVLAVDEVLTRVANFNEALASILDLHLFPGQTFDEIAQQFGVSSRTVKRDWTMARACLHEHFLPIR